MPPGSAAWRKMWNVERARKLWDEGVSGPEIAHRCGTTPTAIYSYAKHYEWPSRKGDRIILCPEKVKGAIQNGHSLASMAEIFKCSKRTLADFITRHNLRDRRKVPGAKPPPGPPAPPPALPKARPVPTGARTLPDLPSISDLYTTRTIAE